MIYVLIALLLITAAISNAVMDTVRFHYYQSVFTRYNPDFWNPAMSWRNKWKNGDPKQGAKFFGSTTFLVFLTDSWHLFQFAMFSSYQIAILAALSIGVSMEWYYWILSFIIVKFIFSSVFELFWSKIFIIKSKT